MKAAHETQLSDYHRGLKGEVENLLGRGLLQELQEQIMNHVPKILSFLQMGIVNEDLLLCLDWFCFRAILAFDGQRQMQEYFINLCIKVNIELSNTNNLAQAFINQSRLAIHLKDSRLLRQSIENLHKASQSLPIMDFNKYQLYIRDQLKNALDPLQIIIDGTQIDASMATQQGFTPHYNTLTANHLFPATHASSQISNEIDDLINSFESKFTIN